MPNNLRELYAQIFARAEEADLSMAQTLYAVGWIFFDIFERADHEEANNGVTITPADFDKFSKEIPDGKIYRDISESQQEFGRAAAEFMEPEIRNRIRAAMDESIVSTVKAYTSGWKTFGFNILAGVLSGVIFAGITFGGYIYVKDDPSLNAAAKTVVGSPNK